MKNLTPVNLGKAVFLTVVASTVFVGCPTETKEDNTNQEKAIENRDHARAKLADIKFAPSETLDGIMAKYASVKAIYDGIDARVNHDTNMVEFVDTITGEVIADVTLAKQNDVRELIGKHSEGLYTGETIASLLATGEYAKTKFAVDTVVDGVKHTSVVTSVADVATGDIVYVDGPVALDKRAIVQTHFDAWMNVQTIKSQYSGLHDFTSLYDMEQDNWGIAEEAKVADIIKATASNSSVPGKVWQIQKAIEDVFNSWGMPTDPNANDIEYKPPFPTGPVGSS